MTPAEKVKALIAKALSTEAEFPEEARTCALSAIKIAAAYNVPIAGPSEAQTTSVEVTMLRARIAVQDGAISLMRTRLEHQQQSFARCEDSRRRTAVKCADLERELARARARIQTLEAKAPKAKEDDKKQNKKNDVDKKTKPVGGKYRRVTYDVDDVDFDDEGGRVITSLYESKCQRCRRLIRIGNQAWWRGPGMGVLCQTCFEDGHT